MSDMRVSRKGRILGTFTQEQLAEGARSGSFVPSDDVLLKGSSAWIKLEMIEDVEFPKRTMPLPLPATAADAPPRPPEYDALYRSADQKLLTGFCAGMAHRFSFQPGVARFAFVVLCIVTGSVLFWGYWLSFLLPRLPTRNVA
jgi:phage shock protein PspC (stress-responsive transcriptional regulator)